MIAIIGYGSQGRAIALNLRDSGFEVMVGLRPRSKSRARARREGIRHVMTIPTAIKKADVICFAFPDDLHGRVYDRQIKPFVNTGATLLFLHGMSVHFGFVHPPAENDVILIAPHAPGVTVRKKYLSGESVSAFWAVFQNASGKAQGTISRLAAGMGIDRKRLIPTTFEQEAVGDMFGEQAVLCGGLATLIKNGFEVLVENGVPPDNAYLEVAYQLDLIVNLIKQYGIEGMFKRISVAAKYGSAEAGPKIINASVKNRMRSVYEQIRSGKFPSRLNQLTEKDIAVLDRALKNLTNPDFERASKKLAPPKGKN